MKDIPKATADTPPEVGRGMRLNRYLARSGVASRRRCDELISSGQVRVNGRTVAEPGCWVTPGEDRVEASGLPVCLPETFEYVAFHKPAGCVVTRHDTHGQKTVFELLPALRTGTVAVGRLDRDTTGLLLLTDDGELAFRLMHPRFGVDKQYEAVVEGRPDAAALARLRRGVELDDGPTAPAQVLARGELQGEHGPLTRLSVIIHEGRKRQVRRMLRSIGHPVLSLKRVAFGELELDVDQPGAWRPLAAAEVDRLRRAVGLETTGGRS